MIVFYRPPESTLSDDIEETLRDLALAHRVVVVENGNRPAELPPDTALPALQEGRELHTGEEAVKAYVDDLEQEVLYGRQFQSDACYLDPDRPGECL